MQAMLTERAGQATKGKGMTDDVIIKRSLDEPDCFAEIFERHADEIARYVHARLGPDLAEDVTESPATTGVGLAPPEPHEGEEPLHDDGDPAAAADRKRALHRPILTAPPACDRGRLREGRQPGPRGECRFERGPSASYG